MIVLAEELVACECVCTCVIGIGCGMFVVYCFVSRYVCWSRCEIIITFLNVLVLLRKTLFSIINWVLWCQSDSHGEISPTQAIIHWSKILTDRRWEGGLFGQVRDLHGRCWSGEWRAEAYFIVVSFLLWLLQVGESGQYVFWSYKTVNISLCAAQECDLHKTLFEFSESKKLENLSTNIWSALWMPIVFTLPPKRTQRSHPRHLYKQCVVSSDKTASIAEYAAEREGSDESIICFRDGLYTVWSV